MAVAMTIEVLPAARGDCLLVECHRAGRPWRLLIDGGLPECWPMVRARLEQLPPGERHLDLVVVTHIDADHIGGLLPLFSSGLATSIGDVWFNGLPQLPDDRGATRSVAQGENLVRLLSAAGTAAPPPWNEAFGRTAVMTGDPGAVLPVQRAGWPAITLLSPTTQRLVRLRTVWQREMDGVRRGEAAEAPKPPTLRADLVDLEAMAATTTPKDSSAANGSSIGFLLEHDGASCLFAADAFSSVLGAALTTLANQRGGRPIDIDVFKLPHHASHGNVTPALLQLVPARHYVVSTNGDRFDHPDDIALARVVTSGPAGLTLWFNYETPATKRWGDPALTSRYGFHARYPDGAGASGVRIELAARP
jgi:beta-lactamase superfamily II metal-dependent hydrolase